jgi:hypothetical protein
MSKRKNWVKKNAEKGDISDKSHQNTNSQENFKNKLTENDDSNSDNKKNKTNKNKKNSNKDKKLTEPKGKKTSKRSGIQDNIAVESVPFRKTKKGKNVEKKTKRVEEISRSELKSWIDNRKKKKKSIKSQERTKRK